MANLNIFYLLDLVLHIQVSNQAFSVRLRMFPFYCFCFLNLHRACAFYLCRARTSGRPAHSLEGLFRIGNVLLELDHLRIIILEANLPILL